MTPDQKPTNEKVACPNGHGVWTPTCPICERDSTITTLKEEIADLREDMRVADVQSSRDLREAQNNLMASESKSKGLEAERDSLRRDWSELSRVALDNRLEADSLRAESEGRLKVLTEKAEEARREWIRAENAEAELLKAGEALSKFVCKDGESCAFAPLHL